MSSNSEAILRQQVAACTLMLNGEDILGYSGHVSARLPGGDAILIQSFKQSRSEVGPDDLLVIGLDGKVIQAPDGMRPPDEVSIHIEIMRARPDVHAALHYHPDVPILFTLVDGVELVPLKSHASRWRSGIPVYPDGAKITNTKQGKDLARTLGPHHAALMRAHGAVVVAETVPALMIDAVHFGENAEALYQAAMLGPVNPLTEAEMDEIESHTHRGRHVSKLWAYYVGRAITAGTIPDEWRADLLAA